ncbi:MAG: radical SAM protein [Clostridia bacterium]|jgi:radical SAM superfamily enzyme YgiQ (UPF0313 family)|nr:radical SAM protein [Clostridia bacterium]
MKILLVKCHRKTIFSKLEPVVTEPLELEYLSALCQNLGVKHRIYDNLLEGKSFVQVFKEYSPRVLVLTGYITAQETIIQYAQYAKEANPQVRVIVGGVHAEVNYRDFFNQNIDIIVHSDGLNTLKKLIESSFAGEKLEEIEGIAYYRQGVWQVNKKIPADLQSLPTPRREYFYQYQNRTKYLHYSPVAMVKTALSCPYNCSFCYCKLLNQGIYATRPIARVVEEIAEIEAPYIWIIDDTFLIERQRIIQFIMALEARGIKKKFIAYSRVDFIVKNKDLIQRLADVGFVELIVGMEAIEDRILDNFNKTCSAQDNFKAVEILRQAGINLTGLFIADIDFTPRDFRHLRKGIRKMGLKSYTASIFTPVKGTQLYEQYKDQLETTDPSKWDFLHLTLKPVHMSKYAFYLHFYLIYIEQFFRSKYIRDFVFKNWKKLLL